MQHSSQNVQDAVDQPAGVTPGSTDMRLRWGEVMLNNLPEIIVNSPEYHGFQIYLRDFMVLGSLLSFFLSIANEYSN